ncbi:hypothetical protein NCG89_11980 [Spongiibacter taiwanensis]|uniref:hypothetical protein n=1 Tax=Spongiibacter taiwanensis TaxID=1748242 RepID=UPI002034EB86|nr:hypothetical protein [Spongiibacter taiwanensis]USA42241.1 hypothetical protein NCG89_11980 [Spongiibacter taiwanensis]
MRLHNSSPFYQKLSEAIAALGGMHNAHLHLDRAGTLDEDYMRVAEKSILETSHISLHEKHHLIHNLHNSRAYQRDDLTGRVNHFLDVMVAANTKVADTLVDVTADGIGLRALEMMQEIQRDRADEITLRIAAYSPFGFRDDEPQHWEIFAEGSVASDFIAALPEADDTREYPDHIGFDEHLRRTLDLAKAKGCMLHVHTDQRNEPTEDGTERLVETIARHGAPQVNADEPSVWAVHAISPSTYDDTRFEALTRGLVENNIGIVCCPSAAIGMRQLRPLKTPTYNSIPRVLEWLAAGVHVRLASDNIADICSPSTTADLVDEVFMLSAALRYYDVNILAKLACGLKLELEERDKIRLHLQQNDEQIAKVLRETDQIPAG